MADSIRLMEGRLLLISIAMTDDTTSKSIDEH